MTNPTIGMIRCPLSGELAAVRKDKRGAFYYISCAGRIAPSTDFGQDWFLAHGTIWGEAGEPCADAPDWIVQGRSYPPASSSRIRGARLCSAQPAKAPATMPAPAPAVTPAPDVAAAVKLRRNPWSIFGADDDA